MRAFKPPAGRSVTDLTVLFDVGLSAFFTIFLYQSTKMKRLLLLAWAIGSLVAANSQRQQIDSLRKLLGRHDSTEVKVLYNFAYAFYNINKDSSIYYIRKAHDLASDLRLMGLQMEVKGGEAELLFRTGNYTQALKVSLEYLKMAESLKDTSHIYWATRSVMMTYEYMPNGYTKIMQYANGLRDLIHSGFFKDSRQREFLELIGYVNHALAYYRSKRNKDSVLYFSQRSYELSSHLGEDQGIAMAAGNMAVINADMGNDELAISYYRTGLGPAKRSNRYDLLADFQIALAELYQKKGYKDSTRHFINLSLLDLEKDPDPTTRVKTYATLSFIFKNDQQFDSAYKYLSLSVEVKDSLYTQEKVSAVETMMTNEQQRQQEIQQKREHERGERKLNLQFLAMALGLIAFVILFLIFSYSIIANQRLIRFLGIVGLLVLFEFINLYIHPYLEHFTDQSPFLMLMIRC